MKQHAWWFHLAQLGASVGIGVATATSIAQFIPYPPVQALAGVIGAIGNAVTVYAVGGVKKDS